MLKRIQKIINIGKFSNCRPPACQFKKETIIFGLNTQGKSTLTAILRSIKTGDNNILIGRKTFGATGTKNIEIDFEESGSENKYVFQNRAWNRTNPNIHIFDSKFITDNIFNGEGITFDQQKNLNTIIIGKHGQTLKHEIFELQKKSDEFTSQKTGKTSEYLRHFPNMDFKKFESLIEDKVIEDKIKNKNKEIKFEQEKENIKEAINNHIQELSNIEFDFRSILAKTIDSKQKEIKDQIEKNLSKQGHAEGFLDKGLDLLKEKPADGSPRACVFCGQELGHNAEVLIAMYTNYFKGGYKKLQEEINIANYSFKNENIEAILGKISNDMKQKELDIGLDEKKTSELTNLKKQFEKELDKKRDLKYSIDFESFDLLQKEIEKITVNLDNLKKKLNKKSPKDLSQLEKEKKQLEIIEARYKPAWINFFAELENIETNAEKVRVRREDKRKELEDYSQGIFDKHKGTINEFCETMGADFKIEDFKPLKKIIGKDERLFTIKFFGSHKVNIDNMDDGIPNYKNTLSESDKRLLALAFFLSLLTHDRDLDKKIIVFDDPMSSFDGERRRNTAHLITDISCKFMNEDGEEKILIPNQKIILTHEDRFAKGLARLIPDACTLKLEDYTENGNKRSNLSHADYDKDFPDDDIANRLEKIKSILEARTFSVPFEEDCRTVLEHIFKRKYYFQLKEDIKNKKSIGVFTSTLAEKQQGSFNETTKLQKFTRLCNDLNKELHDNKTSISNGDKEEILKDFFECLNII